MKISVVDTEFPLAVGQEYKLIFDIGAELKEESKKGAHIDWGTQNTLNLNVSIFTGNESRLSSRVFHFEMQKDGNGATGECLITPLKAGGIELEFVISEQRTLEILQEYIFPIPTI